MQTEVAVLKQWKKDVAKLTFRKNWNSISPKMQRSGLALAIFQVHHQELYQSLSGQTLGLKGQREISPLLLSWAKQIQLGEYTTIYCKTQPLPVVGQPWSQLTLASSDMRGCFWHLVTAATPVVPPLAKPCT